MRFSLTTTLGALAVSLALAPGWASAWEKIKLTTSPYCTPMIIMVTSGKTSKVSMVLLHRKPWWMKFVNKWPQKEEAYCYSRAVIINTGVPESDLQDAEPDFAA